MMDVERVLYQWFLNILIKSLHSGDGIKNKIMSNHHLGKELHKTDTRKLDKGKIRQSFKDNI